MCPCFFDSQFYLFRSLRSKSRGLSTAMKYLSEKFTGVNRIIFIESSVSIRFHSICNTAGILNWYSKENDDYMLVIRHSPGDVVRHLFLNGAAKVLPITLFRKSSCKCMVALSSLSMGCKDFLSLALWLISHNFYQIFSHF